MHCKTRSYLSIEKDLQLDFTSVYRKETILLNPPQSISPESPVVNLIIKCPIHDEKRGQAGTNPRNAVD